MLSRPPSVAAECTFIPPWPEITAAIPSARDIVVGDVLGNVDPAALAFGQGDTEALRVTEVIRGSRYRVGDLIGTDYLLPNWPWAKSSEDSDAYPSCSYLQAIPGERIALAFDSVMPAQRLHDSDNVVWKQPRTRYNAMGVIDPLEPSEGWGEERERVTLAHLRALASLPATDTATPSASPSGEHLAPLLVVAAVLGGGLLLTRLPRDVRRR